MGVGMGVEVKGCLRTYLTRHLHLRLSTPLYKKSPHISHTANHAAVYHQTRHLPPGKVSERKVSNGGSIPREKCGRSERCGALIGAVEKVCDDCFVDGFPYPSTCPVYSEVWDDESPRTYRRIRNDKKRKTGKKETERPCCD